MLVLDFDDEEEEGWCGMASYFCVVRASQGVSGSTHPAGLSDGINPGNRHIISKTSFVGILGEVSGFVAVSIIFALCTDNNPAMLY